MESRSPDPSLRTQVPYAVALIIADGFYRDSVSGKSTLLGTFSVIGAEQFPLKHPYMVVYFVLADGLGTLPLTIKIVRVNGIGNPDEDEVILEASTTVTFPDVTIMQEGMFYLRDATFPVPGEYRVQLLVQGEQLMERRIAVAKVGERGAGGEPGE